MPYYANWPLEETREVHYCINSQCYSIGQINGGENLAEIQYDDPWSPGYWDDFNVVLGIESEPNVTPNISVTTEPSPVLELEVTTQESSGIIHYRVVSETGYSNPSGWGGFPAACEDQKIFIVTEMAVGTETQWLDTVWCVAGVATDTTLTFEYDGPSSQVCLRSYMRRLVEPDVSHLVTNSEQECFQIGDISTSIASTIEVQDAKAFPNPTNGENVTIMSPIPVQGWQMLDMTGKLVDEGGGNTIPTSSWLPGTYVLQIQDVQGRMSTLRVVRE